MNKKASDEKVDYATKNMKSENHETCGDAAASISSNFGAIHS